MKTTDVGRAAKRVETILNSGTLCPAHREILTRWYASLCGTVGEDRGINPGVLVWSLPDEARLAVAMLIAGDLLEQAKKTTEVDRSMVETQPSFEELAPEPHGASFEPAPEPAPGPASDDFEDARERLLALTEEHPLAVQEADVRAAVESGDVFQVQVEIERLLERATQIRAPRKAAK